jgi:hypothetical protein
MCRLLFLFWCVGAFSYFATGGGHPGVNDAYLASVCWQSFAALLIAAIAMPRFF